MSKKRWIGIDVGGANLKVADTDGWTASRTFSLWKQPERLTQALSDIIHSPDEHCRYVMTMTGELADCFSTREQGVRFIIDAVSKTIESVGSVLVYSLDGEMLCGAEAKARADVVGSANWHCLASFATRFVDPDETALLIDIGSTTTDVIPISQTGVLSESRTDFDRLCNSELLYFGVERSPLCALVRELPYRGVTVPVMAELFATTLDVFLVLGHVDEDVDDLDTADGRPRTIGHAVGRLARMIGLDSRDFNFDDAIVASRRIEAILNVRLEESAKSHGAEISTWILSGHGTSLVPPSNTRVINLATELGANISRTGPAYALATIAKERFG